MSSQFTKRFQNSLGSQIEQLLKEWPRAQGLEVGIDTIPTNEWVGRPDIWIRRKSRLRSSVYNRILVIEIEHYSGAYQANTNLEQAVQWANSKLNRRVGFIHLINLESNLTDSKCMDLFEFGYQKRSKRFNYDFRIYRVSDKRASEQLATQYTEDYDFQSLLWQNLLYAGLV